jgi:hypothetical protein
LRDRARARPLVDEVLNFTRTSGYVHFEGVAHRLISECLIVEEPTAAEHHIEMGLGILDRVGARNDFAKALMTRAQLRRADGDAAAADKLSTQALSIFESLGTQEEPAKIRALLGAPARLSPNTFGEHASARLLPSNETTPDTLRKRQT